MYMGRGIEYPDRGVRGSHRGGSFSLTSVTDNTFNHLRRGQKPIDK